MAKETKAQRVERIKKEKDGLEVINDIYVYAVMGNKVDPEDIDRFKWYGLYSQNKNLQDKDDETLYFMLRVKVNQGELNTQQLEVIESISNEFARGNAAITTRQDIQFHFIQVRDLPEIFKRLDSVGLSTLFAAGDVPRNAVSCPVNGIDHDQIYDTRPIVKKVNELLTGNKNFSNLPRKFKVGISGCNKHCINHEIQDISFNAIKISATKVLFDVNVGGGLASNKRIATHLGYVTASQILNVIKAVVKIFRDHGDRSSRTKARVGHIVEKWGIEKFLRVLHEELNFTLKEPKILEYTPYTQREHFGIHESTIKSKSYIGCAISGGRIGASGIHNLLKIMKKYKATTIKLTTTQNLIILDVPTIEAQKMANELSNVGIDTKPSTFKSRTISCTGLNFCKFAISETKELSDKIISHLEKKFPDFEQPISMSVNGCPNSCGHPHIVF
jgi:sulfite reductase (ferredoxin)